MEPAVVLLVVRAMAVLVAEEAVERHFGEGWSNCCYSWFGWSRYSLELRQFQFQFQLQLWLQLQVQR